MVAYPDVLATKLSPYLAHGCLSPRRIAHELASSLRPQSLTKTEGEWTLERRAEEESLR